MLIRGLGLAGPARPHRTIASPSKVPSQVVGSVTGLFPKAAVVPVLGAGDHPRGDAHPTGPG